MEGHADAHRGRQHDRRFQRSPLADGQRPGEFAGTVEHRGAGRHRPIEQRVQRVGNDRGHTGAVLGDGGMADAHAGHIGDRVVRAGGQQSDLDAAVAWAWALLQPLLRHAAESTTTAYGGISWSTTTFAIIGLGGIGSATAWFAARAGRSVIGLERFDLGGHHHGASHDHSRIIRHSYHTPHYVDLTRHAYDAWRSSRPTAARPACTSPAGSTCFPTARRSNRDVPGFDAGLRDRIRRTDSDGSDDSLAGVARRGRHRGAVPGRHRHRLAGSHGAVAATPGGRSRRRVARQRNVWRSNPTTVVIRLADGDACAPSWSRPMRGRSLIAPLGTSLPLVAPRAGHVLRHRVAECEGSSRCGSGWTTRRSTASRLRAARREDRPGLRRVPWIPTLVASNRTRDPGAHRCVQRRRSPVASVRPVDDHLSLHAPPDRDFVSTLPDHPMSRSAPVTATSSSPGSARPWPRWPPATNRGATSHHSDSAGRP